MMPYSIMVGYQYYPTTTLYGIMTQKNSTWIHMVGLTREFHGKKMLWTTIFTRCLYKFSWTSLH